METQTGKVEVDVDAATSVAEFKISPNAPTVLIVMGMAGSGKTTFVQVSFPRQSYLELATGRIHEGAWQVDV